MSSTITVIIPTYKPKDYLLDCLESLDNQTLAKDSYKVIIVLNGNREPYYSLVKGWTEQLGCNTELLYSEQKGVSNARNLALDQASSKYVAFIDDDDYVSPQYLESLLDCATVNSDGVIACSNVATFDDRHEFGTDYISEAYKRAKLFPNKNSLVARRKFLSSSCCKLIPLCVIGTRRFNNSIKIGEDALFMATISDRIKGIVPAADDAVYFRRLRAGSASRSKEPTINRLRRKCKLIAIYIGVYATDVFRYNLFFFLTRILAIIKS